MVLKQCADSKEILNDTSSLQCLQDPDLRLDDACRSIPEATPSMAMQAVPVKAELWNLGFIVMILTRFKTNIA